ncbi:disulfide bond formation protein B [Paenirhodobacter sp. CAU 1674]|jgi:disulfide bond formation protein DsbB|uniref:disulfide bond formation protein B n=1 Tax=Paenirhodobacter sp. CAU 1674 TaxID=3032596 RepID=UPI0023DAB1D7|nr:disulfide bond formation protein B [Paenirhodobacter sp. CAU 1674]MDF2142418.1 disulfide bond formation protein B [Paenirhodobacter sp. CAU 1674]
MLTFLSPRQMIALAAAGSAAVLIGALIFQSLGYPPCDLCILQRWPHLVAAVLGGMIVLFRLPLALAFFGALAALTTAALGIYHSGVERHIFAGPDSCTSNPVGTGSATDLLAQIQAAPLVRCDEIVWDIFGITMANLNAVGSLAFAVLWVMAYRAARRGA